MRDGRVGGHLAAGDRVPAVDAGGDIVVPGLGPEGPVDAVAERRDQAIVEQVELRQDLWIFDAHQADGLERPVSRAFQLHGVGALLEHRSGDPNAAVVERRVDRFGDVQNAAGLDEQIGVAVLIEHMRRDTVNVALVGRAERLDVEPVLRHPDHDAPIAAHHRAGRRHIRRSCRHATQVHRRRRASREPRQAPPCRLCVRRGLCRRPRAGRRCRAPAPSGPRYARMRRYPRRSSAAKAIGRESCRRRGDS